jgi:hypothetical protein
LRNRRNKPLRIICSDAMTNFTQEITPARQMTLVGSVPQPSYRHSPSPDGASLHRAKADEANFHF